MATEYTPNENLYKWKTTDSKQTTIQEMSSNAVKIDEKLNDHTVQLADTLNLVSFGGVGDNSSNNSQAFKNLWTKVKDYTSIHIPDGIFKVVLSDSDLTDLGQQRDYAFLLLTGKKGITFTGNGKIIFDTSACTKRAWFLVFKDCLDCSVDGLKLDGTLITSNQSPNSETGVGMAVMFYHCTNSKLINSAIRKVIVPYSVTGNPNSPATTAEVTDKTIISNNLFENFEQNSTFGGGASELIISNNTFLNMYTGMKISGNPMDSPLTVDQSKNIIVKGNIFRWTRDFEFAKVFFDQTKSYAPVGIMIEANTNNILIDDNIIDMTDTSDSTLPLVNTSCPIVTFNVKSGTNGEYDIKNVAIKNNTLIGDPKRTRYSISIQPNIHRLSITNNECVGGISVDTSTIKVYKYTLRVLNNNIKENGTLPAIIQVNNGTYYLCEIAGNTLKGDPSALISGDESLILISSVTADKLIVKGNTLINGKISDYASGTIKAIDFEIFNNSCNGVALNTSSALTRLSLGNNVIKTNGTAMDLVLDGTTKANCIVNICGNIVKGTTTDGAVYVLKLNGGKLRLDGNSFFTSASAPFSFDSTVNILSGVYWGSGVPNQTALFGVMYIDYSAGSDATYIKTTPSGSTGWKKIATV